MIKRDIKYDQACEIFKRVSNDKNNCLKMTLYLGLIANSERNYIMYSRLKGERSWERIYSQSALTFDDVATSNISGSVLHKS